MFEFIRNVSLATCFIHSDVTVTTNFILPFAQLRRNAGGILLYEQQEGRGIGLLEKLRAYELQDRGFDTVEANLQLGHAVDSRDYALAVAILQSLEVHSIRLMSNNPDKLMAVSSAGICIVERVGADVPASPHSAHYIATKRDKLGHLSNAAAVSPGFESREAEGAFPGKLCSEANGSRAEARANL